MRLEKLEIANFRNLVNQTIEFPTRVTVLVGNNGHGKTSVIEAIYMLAHARSFRTHSAKDLVNWAASDKSCSVIGSLKSIDGDREVAFNYSNGKRSISLNGNDLKKASSFFGKFLAIVFTPDELMIVKGAPSLRRKFCDKIISMCDPSYVEHLVAYQRSLKSRNLILSQKKGRVLKEEISPWNELLARDGRIVAGKRAEFIREIEQDFKNYYKILSREARCDEEVDLNYNCHFFKNGEPLGESEIIKIIDESFDQDLRYSSTNKGIHRDELSLYLNFDGNKKEARSAASQGQSRSIAISLKLAASKFIKLSKEESPIVLLDDVESELDKTRIRAMYEVLEGLQAQVIITSTEPSEELIGRGAEVSTFKLQNGELSP